MKKLDLDRWDRKDIYNIFRGIQFPHFSVTSEVDVTELLAFSRDNGLQSYRLMLYLVAKVSNSLRAFRLRLVPDGVVEHEKVGVAPTMTGNGRRLNFLHIPYIAGPVEFLEYYARQERRVRRMRRLNTEDDKKIGDACIYVSCVPWLHFTGITSVVASIEDSIPRVTWGKYVERNGRTFAPMGLQCHHSLMDGIDVAEFFSALQSELARPGKTFSRLKKRA